MQKINIAIDGYSACGKSTLAKQLAKKLNYIYVDTGAMYRAVALYCLENGIDSKNEVEVHNALSTISIRFLINKNAGNETFLNGKNVEEEIRTLEVSNIVSPVSAISSVRRFLVQQQKIMAKQKGVVMDGRDIGTVVLPDAGLKVFVTADIETRIQRRLDEFKNKNVTVSFEEVKKNLEARDYQDTHRSDSPLRQAVDAKLLDNTHLTREEQLQIVYEWAEEKIES